MAARDSRPTTSPGQIVKGKVTKITNFGVFVELEPDLEGLLHIRELADHKVENPQDVVKVGEEIEVKILRVDPDERKIGLSKKRAEWADRGRRAATAARPKARRGGLHGRGEVSTDLIHAVPVPPAGTSDRGRCGGDARGASASGQCRS